MAKGQNVGNPAINGRSYLWNCVLPVQFNIGVTGDICCRREALKLNWQFAVSQSFTIPIMLC